MKKYIDQLKSANVFRAILVVQDIKAFSRQALVFLGAVYPIFHIEVFQVTKKTKHILIFVLLIITKA